MGKSPEGGENTVRLAQSPVDLLRFHETLASFDDFGAGADPEAVVERIGGEAALLTHRIEVVAQVLCFLTCPDRVRTHRSDATLFI